jgi:hypothetical protein
VARSTPAGLSLSSNAVGHTRAAAFLGRLQRLREVVGTVLLDGAPMASARVAVAPRWIDELEDGRYDNASNRPYRTIMTSGHYTTVAASSTRRSSSAHLASESSGWDRAP